MTLGRLATFLGILAVSLAGARELVRRRAVPGPGAAEVRRSERRPPAPKTRLAPGPPVPSGNPAGFGLGGTGTARELDPLTDALCSGGMVLVDGTTCAETVHPCKDRDPRNPDRCLRFEPASCHSGQSLRFCIDRDEYPNQEGMLPAVMVTFELAESACKEESKRLCSESEWAFACEGEGGFAFPYGDERDGSACNVEKKVTAPRPEDLWEARDVAGVLERIDARTPSGAMPRCVSPFGVRDMIGNVEEWVESDTGGTARTLRGGEYTSDPTCRTVRKMRTDGFRQFHTGFRCCKDPLVRVPRRAVGNAAGPARPVAPGGRFD